MSGAWPARLGFLAALLATAGCVRRPPLAVEDVVAPAQAEPGAAREREEPAEPAPSAPRMLPEPDRASAAESVDGARARVVELLGLLAGRELSEAQREERDAGVSFLAQVQEALDAGDPERAGMLVDKARILVENLERATRP